MAKDSSTLAVVFKIIYTALVPTLCGGSVQHEEFMMFTQNQEWRNARQVCTMRGGDLAVIHQTNFAYLQRAFAENPQYNVNNVWIGLYDVALKDGSLGTEGFIWSTCRRLGTSDWENWVQDLPDPIWNEFCICLKYNSNWEWFPQYCGSGFYYLCQKVYGSCITFTPYTDGCDTDRATNLPFGLTAMGQKYAQTEVECQTACVSYIAGSGDTTTHCWMYGFTSSLKCTIYVGIDPVFCGQSSGAAVSADQSAWRVRDCYSLTYNTTVISGLPSHAWDEKAPEINCTAVASPSSAQDTTTASTQLNISYSLRTVFSPTIFISSSSSSSGQATNTNSAGASQPAAGSRDTTASTDDTTSTSKSSASNTATSTTPSSNSMARTTTTTTTTAATPAMSTSIKSGTTTLATSTGVSPAKTNSPSNTPTTTKSNSMTVSAVTPASSNSVVSTTVAGSNTATDLQGNTDLQQTTGGQTQCLCICRDVPPISLNYTVALERANDYRTELMLNKSTLSSTRRQKESAPDNRPSAQAAGGVGIIILVLVAGLIMAPDFIAVFQALCFFCKFGKKP